MDKVNALALDLAAATVEYYSVKKHCDAAGTKVLREDARALRLAYDMMCDVQNQMALAAEQVAE